MGPAFPFSWIPAGAVLYGLTVGLGKHRKNVTDEEFRRFNIALIVLQRGNAPCLLYVKTSILLFYTRLFPKRTFKRVALAVIPPNPCESLSWRAKVWVFTLCWAIAAFNANMFQCLHVSYFWNKNQLGHCIPHALITIGVTNGVLSFFGDLVILSLPIPMILKLQINTRRKISLVGMFLLGGFVCLTSILRFVALAKINVKDLTFTQVGPGMWTYIELGIGITSGSLPLLRPIFGRFFGTETPNQSSNAYCGKNSIHLSAAVASRATVIGRGDRADGFYRMDKVDEQDTGSEIELHSKNKTTHDERQITWEGNGISVKSDVHVRVEQLR